MFFSFSQNCQIKFVCLNPMHNTLILLFIGFAFVLMGCDKDEKLKTPEEIKQTIPTDTTAIRRMGKIDFAISNMAGNSTISFGSIVQNDAGERMTVDVLSYYLSNFKLIYATGDTLSIPESYYLIDINRLGGGSFTLNRLNAGKIIGLQFLIGVDSARNTTGAQTGDLDPKLGMFWTWESGYIMAKLEGKYTTGSETPNKDYSYHCGGFAAPYSSIRKVQLPLDITVDTLTKNMITLKGDVLEWFKNPNRIRIDSVPNIGDAGPMSNIIADNYQDMFSIKSVNQVPYQ